MNKRNFRPFLQVMGFSLGINALLFSLLPSFGQKAAKRKYLETPIPVNVIQFRRPKPPPPVENRQKPEKKMPKKMIPTVNLRFSKRMISQRPRPELDMPRLGFRINPRLKIGMPVSPPPQEPPAFKAKESYLQGEVDQIPIPIVKMKPLYPYRARRLNISGAVKVKFLVDENGHVNKIKILKSTPSGVFDKSVLDALALWKFSPGRVRGHPVSTWVVTTIEFKMD